MKLKFVGVSGSPRHGNTELMVKAALEAAKNAVKDEAGVEVETRLVSLAAKDIKGCLNCRACIKQGKCILKDDWEECFKPMLDPVPDGVILGAPVYFFSVNSQMRAYLERTTSLLKANFFPEAHQTPPDWSHTVGASLAVGYDRNGGQEHTIDCLNSWLLVNDFLVVGGKHVGYIGAPGWQMGESQKDSVGKDELVGLRSCAIIGEHIARAALLMKRGAEAGKN